MSPQRMRRTAAQTPETFWRPAAALVVCAIALFCAGQAVDANTDSQSSNCSVCNMCVNADKGPMTCPAPQKFQCPAGTGGSQKASGGPIRLIDGTPVRDTPDLVMPGPIGDLLFSHGRTHSGKMNLSTAHQGPKWFGGAADVFLDDVGSDIYAHFRATDTLKFTGPGPNYTPPAGTKWTMVDSGDFITVTDYLSGKVLKFYDFNYGQPAYRGRLAETTTLNWSGSSGWTFYYNIDTDDPLFAYGPTGQNYLAQFYYTAGTIDRVKIFDTAPNPDQMVQEAIFTYKSGSHHADVGNTGMLVQVQLSTKLSNGSFHNKYYQYRYSADALDQAFSVEDVETAIQDSGSLNAPGDLLNSSDATVAPYAGERLTYATTDTSTSSVTTAWGTENLESKYGGSAENETGMAVEEVVAAGSGGGCCGGGGNNSTLKYYYLNNPEHSAGNLNSVQKIRIEDIVDSANSPVRRTIIGLNQDGFEIRSAITDNPTAGTPRYWCESRKLNADNTIAEYRRPSAHNVTSDATLRTFFDGHAGTNGSNDANTLFDTTGVIYVYEYNGEKLQNGVRVKQGKNGTAHYVSGTIYYIDENVGAAEARKALVVGTYTYPTKVTSRTSGDRTTLAYTFWSGTNNIQTIQTTLPSVGTLQNGSGAATSTWQYFDSKGRLRWTVDGEGYVTYLSYHPNYGQLTYRVADANPASLPASASAAGNDTKWVTPADGSASTNKPTRGSLPTALQAVVTTELDQNGRAKFSTDYAGVEHWTVYQGNSTYSFPSWNGTQPRLPIQVTVTDNGGRVTDVYQLAPSKATYSGDDPTGVSAHTQVDYLSWQKSVYSTTTGQLSEQRVYHLIPSSGEGTVSTNYSRTVLKYDTLGRPATTVQVVSGTATSSAVEQVTQQIYDSLGRVVEVKQGVSAANHDMGSTYGANPTLQRIGWTRYDDGAVGDGHVSVSLAFHDVGATDNTGSRYYRDFLGRVRGVEPLSTYNTSTQAYTSQGPFSVTDLDWAGRATAAASYTTAPTWSSVISNDSYASGTATNRRSLIQTYFDKLGRAYLTESHNISASDGSSLGKVQQNTYYNRNGQVVASQQVYGAGTEMAYDGLGRQYQTRQVVDLEATKYVSDAFNYRDPKPNSTFTSLTGGDDQVLELTHQEYDTLGNVTGQHSVEMIHTDSNGLSMSTSTSYVRSTVYSWYDAANRVTAVGNYGTGHSTDWVNGTLPTRPGTAPTASSSSVLVTIYSYDSSTGRPNEVTDPKGKKVRSYFDAAGRTTYVADNYVDFNATTEANTGGGTNNDQDQVVKTLYNAAGAVIELVALDRTGDGTATTTDNESTKYLYEDAVNAALVTSEIYPDSSDTTSAGTDQVKKTYFLNGQLKTKTDQRGVVITYAYNAFRGLETESVTTVPGGVDSTVRILRRTYDSLRRPLEIQSMDVSANILNEVEYTYADSIGVARSYQDHDSAVNTGSTPYVEYGYDTSVVSTVYDDGLRPTSFRMPSGNFQYQVYSGTINDALHRVSGIQEDFSTGSSLTVANYAYNGRGRLVEVDYTQPTVKLRRDDDANGSYEALDQFGRIKTQSWKHSGGALMDHVSYQYDYASNRTARDISSSLYATNNLDQVYGYDSLHRLKNFDEGSMSDSSIASPTKEQDWALDTLGNWNNLTEKTSGSTTLNQNRGHNNANELTTIAGASTYVGHDAAGNMTKVPKPTNWSSAYDLEFDAWNRLVRVKDGGATVASYSYDGLHRRIVKTVGATTEQHYYNEQWQLLEVRIGTEASAARQKYVWHPYYIDALAQRFWDGNSDGDFLDANEKHFVMHDGNFNVTSVMTTGGTVFERYFYSPYGQLTVLNA